MPAFLSALPAALAQLSPESVGLGVGIGFVLLIIFAVCTAIALFALWLWMLIDCARTPDDPRDPNARIVWILVLVFTGWLGAVLYFFIVRQPRRARSFAPVPHRPAPPPFRAS